MKKSELKEMISEIVEEKLEDFFINDLNEIVTKIVSTKMSKMLKEANKGTLKDRIMNKIADILRQRVAGPSIYCVQNILCSAPEGGGVPQRKMC